MKRKIFLIIFILVSVKTYGQKVSTSLLFFDSVCIEYFAWCNDTEYKIVVKEDSVCFYKVVDFSYKNNKYALTYTVKNRKKIEKYFFLLDAIYRVDPNYDEYDGLIVDCRLWMKFSFFIGEKTIEKKYILDESALFPFAFTELYCLIIPIISKK